MKTSLRRWVRQYGGRAASVAGLWLAMAIAVSGFGNSATLYAVLEYNSVLGLVALGIGVTIICGELDLSVASIAALAGIVAIKTSSAGLFVALGAAVATGGFLGATQGWLIARLRINSVAFTIGTAIAIRGLAYVASNNQTVSTTGFGISDTLLNRTAVFSIGGCLALVIYIAAGLFLRYLRYGRELYAIGGSRTEAETAGVSLTRTLTTAFAFSGFCGGLAGGLGSLKDGAADPSNYQDLLLLGVTAALIGGIRLQGGGGSPLNVFLGVVFLGALTTGLTLANADPSVTQIVTGGALFAVVTFEFVISRRGQSVRGAAHVGV